MLTKHHKNLNIKKPLIVQGGPNMNVSGEASPANHAGQNNT